MIRLKTILLAVIVALPVLSLQSQLTLTSDQQLHLPGAVATTLILKVCPPSQNP